MPIPFDLLCAENVASWREAIPYPSKPECACCKAAGNAVDAGVATILAASVIEFSPFSFGGEVPILIKLKRE
jgi:gamma-glutamyltranspeptidase